MSEVEGETQTNQVSVAGVAAEWEATREVRVLLTESGSIVKSPPGKYHPNDNVEGVGVNIATLIPLAKRLMLPGVDARGFSLLGMVTIPSLESELLF